MFREETACSSLQYLILSHKMAFDLHTSAHNLVICQVCLRAARSPFPVQWDYVNKEIKKLLSIINNGKKIPMPGIRIIWHINITL